MVFDFLQPISASVEEYIATLSNQTLGKKVVFHTQTDFPVLDNVAIAIITVNEFRGSEKDNNDYRRRTAADPCHRYRKEDGLPGYCHRLQS